MPTFRRLMQCFLLLCLLAFSCAQAEELCALVPAMGGTLDVRSTEIEGESWLFLPSHADISQLSVALPDGSVLKPDDVSEADGVFTVRFADTVCRVMRSENIRSLFVFSDDPENYGREYIESSIDHSTYSTGALLMLGPDGAADHVEEIRKLRGRGNGTWKSFKKPYQIKLEEKTDLLDTGDFKERERTWVLLAMASDRTYLHDRITLDLAKELGDETASNSEYVNLYYDGEYRGLYLLCEKTEIGSGRIDELDYDDIIEELFERAGRSDLETLSAGESQNAYGNAFTYMENMTEPNTPAAGAFLLELENASYTLSDPCWFTLSDGTVYASKNPEMASETMMRYVSERLEEALQTLRGRGVNPQNGRTLSDDFDVEAFARSILISELSGNVDSYSYSSTFFVLPAGETRFTAGPPWDYDLAYRYAIQGDLSVDAIGFRDKTGWIPSFLSCQEFRAAIQQLCSEKLTSLIFDVLLGDRHNAYLKPIDAYLSEIDAARRMNEMLWEFTPDARWVTADSFEEGAELLKHYLAERGQWLLDVVSIWDQNPEQVDLWAEAVYSRVETDLNIGVFPWSAMRVDSYECMQLTEATEEEYALWQLDVTLAPLEGYSFTNPTITVNGTAVDAIANDDGTFSISFTFEDPSYRPVDAYGEDIGLIYDYDIYTQRYPEVAEMCEYDPEQVLDYFLDEGMYEGHQANAFFSPQEMYQHNLYLGDYLGEDWWLYYQEYLAYGYTEWRLPAYASFELKVIE